MRSIVKKVAVAFGGIVMSASFASAQFDYATTGRFQSGLGSCNNPVAAFTVTCSGSGAGLGLNLTFTGVNELAGPATYASGSQIVLGSFTPSGTGTFTLPPGALTFTLFINQTAPNGGTGSFIGSISGALTLNPLGSSGSSLIWSPNEIVAISPVLYDLEFSQNMNGITIGANTTTSINAIATVPEPSTYMLLATGLGALGMVARRRRTNV